MSTFELSFPHSNLRLDATISNHSGRCELRLDHLHRALWDRLKSTPIWEHAQQGFEPIENSPFYLVCFDSRLNVGLLVQTLCETWNEIVSVREPEYRVTMKSKHSWGSVPAGYDSMLD